jgi:hypothetical protein
MGNYADSKNWDFDITKAQIKVLSWFTEINQNYSIISKIYCHKNYDSDDKIMVENYLTIISEKLNTIQNEIEQLKQNLKVFSEIL